MTFAEKLEQRGIEKGIRKGRQEGRQEGLQEGMKTVVLNLLKEGAEVPFIAKVTGLSAAEIEHLQTPKKPVTGN